MSSGMEPDVSAFSSALAARWYADEPGTTHRRLSGSLLSADLSGFTALSERLASLGKEGAERLTATVNGAFTALIDAAAREGGDVLKFGGDALLIWFEGEDDGVRAARAAARMQHSLGATRFARAGLRMSVGAHRGDFDMFLVGEAGWRELVLLGEPVTTTVGLESAANAGEVLVSTALARMLPTPWRGVKRPVGVVLDLTAVTLPRRPVPDPASYNVAALVAPALRNEARALASLGGEHRLATIVFLELEGTDHSLVERGPEIMASSLSALMRATHDAAAEYGVQFLYTDVIADGVKMIATAGAPATTANDEQAALRFALDLVHGDPQAKLRAGVNRGRVFAGFLGSPSRRTYTVMGDPVNLSARLMAHAHPGQVVASVETVEASGVELRTTSLPPFLVKGKSQPIDAAVVDGILEVRRPTRPLDLPLVGRDAELARLGQLVEQLGAGRGIALELLGDAGIGKSRLVREVAADDRIVARVTVTCQPYETHTAYAAARQLVRRVLGIPQEADRHRAGEILTQIVGRVAPRMAPWLPLIAVPADAQVALTPESAAVAEQFRTARIHEVVSDLLLTMLPAPSLVHVEDAYYADQASIGLFDALASRVAAWPWIFLASLRPNSPSVFTRDTGETLKLEPLSTEAVAALARSAFVASFVSKEVGDLSTMAQRASGNPLFALQLVEARQAGVADADLPESIERVLAERLDRLAPVDRTLLRHAAVLGPRFDAELLGDLLAHSGEPAPGVDVWERLGDLIEPDSDQHYRFRHLLYRDVAYEGLPFARRKDLHRQVGELLERTPAPDVSLLSEHFFRADDPERTWRYSVQAGDRAWEHLAVTEAAASYERALEVRRRLRGLEPAEVSRVCESLGDALERSARYDDADARYDAAMKSRSNVDPVGLALLYRKRGVLRERLGSYSQALRWYSRGQRVLADGGAQDQDAPLLVATAGVRHRQGRHVVGLRLASEASARAAALGDAVNEAEANLMALACANQVPGSDSESFGRKALALFRQINDVHSEGKTLNNLGIHSYYRGDWTAAANAYRLAADCFERAGVVAYVASTRVNLAEILSDQGHWPEAIDLFDTAQRTFEHIGHRFGAAIALANRGRAYARNADAGRAEGDLDTALAEFLELGSADFVTETRLRVAEAALLRGDLDTAGPLLDAAADGIVPGTSFPGSLAFKARIESWFRRQTGDDAGALAAGRSAIELAAAEGATFEHALALAHLAELDGDPSLRERAQAELDGLGVVRLPALPRPL